MLFGILAAQAANVTLSPGDDVASLTASLQPGDTVTFNAGTYTLANTVTWSGLGTAEAPITIKGEGAILELSSGWAGIYLNTSSFVHIEGLTIRAAAGNTSGFTGLYVDDVTDLTLTDLEIGPVTGTALTLTGNTARVDATRLHLHDTTDGNGIYAGCYDASCWVEDATFTELWVHDIGGDSHGIELEPGCQGVTIADNVVYRITGWGIITDSTEYGDRNVVEGNAVWETTAGGIYVRGSALVRNNVVFNSAGNGMMLTDGDRGTLADAVVSFNTISDAGDYAVEVHDWAGYTGLVFANNVVSNPTGYGLYFNENGHDDTTLLSHNVVTGLVNGLDPAYAGADTPVIDGAGRYDFVNAEVWDFYPASGGALVDAGDASSAVWVPTVDFNGAPREGNAPDVGAYEWEQATNPGWALQEGYKDLDAYNAVEDEVQGGCCGDKETGAEEALLLGIGLLGWRRRRRVRTR
jgi:hypothetical protein